MMKMMMMECVIDFLPVQIRLEEINRKLRIGDVVPAERDR